ncbi:PTS transporter subunit EIIC [Vagococcus sp. BWB3-3]|uniref:PTS transporter subunit EIIC n=1 Tax=Vagococcus allomyrinae TaxID=2794353 RepID=A0A940P761_9ENTE|nr:PTS transporter subunit EIIC [Vagococcus allomyrinae]MBP1042320.1 PTS transporter subunit EIIC [Vagococcus allomyrinae]
MKEKMVNKLQQFSKAMIGPVLFLPIIGLGIAATSVMTNTAFVTEGSAIYIFGKFISSILWAVMNNLSFFFCVGIAMGMARKKKAEAAFVAAMSFFMFLNANTTWLMLTNKLAEGLTNADLYGSGQTFVLGFKVTDMGVFLGILLGVLVAFIHNKYIDKEFKGAFSIYGNSKFVLIVLIPLIAIFAMGVTYLWPVVQQGITALTGFMNSAGAFGVFLYGFLNRFLIPTGLHHLIWSPFVFSSVGGQMLINGEMYIGAKPIFLAEIADPSILTLDPSARFLVYGMVKIFGILGVALAFYKTAYPKNKNRVKTTIFPSAITSFLVGITEPLEFMFIFSAPILWLVYSVIDGFFQMLSYLAGVRISATNGVIDFLVYNIPAGAERTRWIAFVLLGLLEIVVMYVVFKFMIEKFKLKTPGRETELVVAEGPVTSSEDDLGSAIVAALGGAANIQTVENCFSRLRVDVTEEALVDEAALMVTGASGIVRKPQHVQVVYGMKINAIRTLVDDELGIKE